LHNPKKHRYPTKIITIILTYSIHYQRITRIIKKGINQVEPDLSPSVASIELHSNHMWRDLRGFYSLVGVFEKLLNIKKAGN
jgi:hypothetical protein